MPTNPKNLDPAILEPISAAAPAGIDIANTQEGVDFDKLYKEARSSDDGGPVWKAVVDAGLELLRTRTKDLRVGRTLLEGLSQTHGFDGVHDGIWLLHRLLTDYWDLGLYPLIVDGDREYRGAPLNWLNEKLGAVVRALPLTTSEPPYSRNHFEYAQSQKNPDELSLSQFNEGMKATSTEHLEQLAASIRDTMARIVELNQLTMERFGPETFSYANSLNALKDCLGLVERSLEQRKPVDGPIVDGPATGGDVTGGSGAITGLFGLSEAAAGSWQKAEELIRAGQIEPGVREMSRLAATEPNGRARFFRKLLLADVCMRSRRDKLAVKILEELNEQIETYKLAQWETSEVVGAVWTRLHRLYAKAGDTADAGKADKLYHELSRLDPWQAMNL